MIKLSDGFKGERSLTLPKYVIDAFKKDQIAHNLYLTAIGFFPYAEHHFIKREQGSEQYIIILCRQGKGWVEIDNTKYTIEPNQYIILPPGIKHSYGASKFDPWSIYWIHFDGNCAFSFQGETNTPRTLYPNYNSKISDAIRSFEQTYDIFKQGYSVENVKYALSLLYHFLGSVTYMSSHEPINKEEGVSSDYIEKTIQFMKENIEGRLDRDQLSEYCGVNVAILTTNFKKRTGYSLLSYFNQLKIQQACHYLEHTNMSILQISSKIGIKDQFYFSRLFTKVMGVSPRNYRSKKEEITKE